ncbi:GNAT family N-acetyltransferase [Pendulispora albinea]|uniref:GNAT family N-acetyltransferase n=1 Tax=Pendulispora albinea TaxID=2741071 RepID=A0ABZ2LVW3_9BACT
MFDALEESLQREILEGPRRGVVRLPDLRLIERPGWFQLVTPSFRQGGFNEVICSSLPISEADSIIDTAVSEYRQLGIKFRWAVYPNAEPADLGERLERRGLVKSPSRAMFTGTRHPDVPFEAETFAYDEGTTVEEVGPRTIEAFTRVMATGWNVEEGPLQHLHRTLLSNPDRTHRLFLARHHGRAAGAASYIASPLSAVLLGAIVLPPFRRRGLYRALIAARLHDARTRNITFATTYAREETSAPILERLGFHTAFRYATYYG